MRKYQIKIFLILLIITSLSLVLWINSKENISQILQNPFLSISQISAIIGVIYLSIEYILSARYTFLERIFNGLDKVYRYHHLLGITAFILITSHIIFRDVHLFIEKGTITQLLASFSETPILFGAFSFISLIVLLSFTLIIKLPYHVWKKTHNFIGIPLLLIIFHLLLINSDITRDNALKVWVLLFTSFGIISFLYKAFIYPLLYSKYRYKIEKVVVLPGAIFDFYCKPMDKKLNFKAGQFVFTEFISKAVSREHHPFTITSSPDEEYLRLSIKIEGDYTKNIGKVISGDEVILYGPYGTMNYEFLKTDKTQIWIGGGIGVAPFLSQIKTLPKSPKIILYYLTPSKVISAYDKELIEISKNLTNLKYYNNCSNPDGRLTIEKIRKEVNDFSKVRVFMCGPTSLMNDFTKEFLKVGVKKEDIVFEEFIFKE